MHKFIRKKYINKNSSRASNAQNNLPLILNWSNNCLMYKQFIVDYINNMNNMKYRFEVSSKKEKQCLLDNSNNFSYFF